VAAASFLVSTYYSSKMSIDRVPMTASQVRQEATALLTLGFAFLASGFLSLGAAYVIRIMVLWADGVEAAGRYQAAWTIGGLYAGFVLQAMGTDFYPRLTAVCRDDEECTRLVNEQTQISLLLAGPGVIATLTFAPLVLHIFYSAEFQSAVSILRWFCLGMMLRVAAWPMGFIVVAKGAQRTLIIIEVIAALLHVGFAWLLIKKFGTDGAGIAFCGLYICYTALIYLIVNRLSGFRWSAENLQLGCLLLGLATLVFWSVTMLQPLAGSLVGGVAAALVGIYCIRRLLHFVSPALLPRPLRGWLIVTEPEGP
jgi:PST family polysaccharide transporter